MLLNCGVGEDSESPFDCKEIQSVHPKGNQSWIFIGNWSWNSSTLATWWEEVTHLKRPWCWERLKTGGEGDVRGWDGWMASPTQWTRVWVSSWSWWWTGKPGVLQSMGCQRVRHNLKTEQHMSYGSRHFPFKLKMQYLYKYIYTYIYKLRLEGKFWMWM